jgi:RNA polymerase sigma factor (sigma-70 family)
LTRVRPSARLDVIEVQSVNEQRPLSAQASARVGSADFAVVYDRYHEALYRYCWSILHQREDAQDALQSTMERAFVALQRERREIEWRPWLFCIARNEAVSILRRRRDTYALRDTAAPGGDIGESLFAREEIRALQSDLANLSERQHAALVMREVNGLGLEEIARLLGCSAAAAKQAIFEARGALLKCREGREMACADVRRALSDGDRRRLRGHGLRSHLRACGACRGFQAALKDRARAARALPAALGARRRISKVASRHRRVVGGDRRRGGADAGRQARRRSRRRGRRRRNRRARRVGYTIHGQRRPCSGHASGARERRTSSASPGAARRTGAPAGDAAAHAGRAGGGPLPRRAGSHDVASRGAGDGRWRRICRPTARHTRTRAGAAAFRRPRRPDGHRAAGEHWPRHLLQQHGRRRPRR